MPVIIDKCKEFLGKIKRPADDSAGLQIEPILLFKSQNYGCLTLC